MIIVGVDPGLTTGLCSVNGDKLSDGIELTHLWEIYRWLRNAGPEQIVMEDFHGGHKGDYKHPLKVMGAVELFAGVYNIPLAIQNPSVQVRFRDKLTKAHPSRHVRSALAHVYYWMYCNTR